LMLNLVGIVLITMLVYLLAAPLLGFPTAAFGPAP